MDAFRDNGNESRFNPIRELTLKEIELVTGGDGAAVHSSSTSGGVTTHMMSCGPNNAISWNWGAGGDPSQASASSYNQSSNWSCTQASSGYTRSTWQTNSSGFVGGAGYSYVSYSYFN
jgi:hypothetical protein